MSKTLNWGLGLLSVDEPVTMVIRTILSKKFSEN